MPVCNPCAGLMSKITEAFDRPHARGVCSLACNNEFAPYYSCGRCRHWPTTCRAGRSRRVQNRVAAATALPCGRPCGCSRGGWLRSTQSAGRTPRSGGTCNRRTSCAANPSQPGLRRCCVVLSRGSVSATSSLARPRAYADRMTREILAQHGFMLPGPADQCSQGSSSQQGCG